MSIYGIEWQFWSWKTAFAVYLSFMKWGEKVAILSNIRMSDRYIPNFHYFNDDDLLRVLRTINKLNDEDREKYSKKAPSKSWKIDDKSIFIHERDKFTKFVVILDEVWILYNSSDYRDFDNTISNYILQCRKLNTDLFFINQITSRTLKNFREHLDWVLYSKPLVQFPFLDKFIIVRKKKVDIDGKTQMEFYLWKDQNWDYVKKEKPLDFYYSWYYQPTVYKMYDDWFKNIIDREKDNIHNEIYNNFKEIQARYETLKSQKISFIEYIKGIFKNKEKVFLSDVSDEKPFCSEKNL